ECLRAMREVLAARDICTAFLRMNPLLDDRLSEFVTDPALHDNGVTVSIDVVQSPANLWSSMRKGHTNAINKAKRFGYDVTIGAAADRFDQFFAVYSETLDRLDADSQYRFTPAYLKQLMAMPQSYVVLAMHSDDVAGAYLFFETSGIVQMHLG